MSFRRHRRDPGEEGNADSTLQRLFAEAAKLWDRALRTGDRATLDKAVDLLRHVLHAAGPAHPNRPGHLALLALALTARMQRSRDPADLDEAIAIGEEAVMALADHPGRPILLYNLGAALRARFDLTDEMADLERAIDVFEQAVASSPDNHPERPACLSGLAVGLQTRFERTGGTADLDRAIILFEEAVAATPDGHAARSGYLSNLGNALRTRSWRTGDATDLDRAITVGEQAVAATADDDPHGPGYRSNLGMALGARFWRRGDPADLDRAISLFEEAVTATPTGHPDKPDFRSKLAAALRDRFERTGDSTDIDRAVGNFEQALAATPGDRRRRPWYLSGLGAALGVRFERAGGAADLDRAIDQFEQAVATAPADHPDRPRFLSDLGIALRIRFEHTGDAADLRRAITVGEEAVATIAADHPVRPEYLSNLGNTLRISFQHTGDAADLDGAIDQLGKAVATTAADRPEQAKFLLNLGSALQTRFEHIRDAADLIRALDVLREATAVTSAPVDVRTHAARLWGRSAMAAQRWGEAVDAFGAAVALAALAVPWELARTDQEFRLGEFAGLGSEAAAACLQAGDPARAVELFEQGRAVMFSQVLDARSDVTDLRQAHPQLAKQFALLRDVLDRPYRITGPMSGDIDSATAARADADARRAAAAGFDQVLNEIRTKPGFDRFLAPRQLSELLPAAAGGPVVLLNIAPWRSDALLLTREGVTELALPGAAADNVMDQTNAFLEAIDQISQPDASKGALSAAELRLQSVLGWLADHITSPVLDHLGYDSSSAPEEKLPRAWWCPSGALSLLPLHAAGHHDLPGEPSDAVIDRVISSTIPTLRALVHARRPSQKSPVPQLLVVAMPQTNGHDDLEVAGDVAALGILWKNAVTVLGMPDGEPATFDNVRAGLPSHRWAHFACHAESDLLDPSSSRLLLVDQPLTVLDMTHAQLPDAEVAFLAACSTGRPGMRLPDEPIHLAAACQLAGFRHVVAALWHIVDFDTSLLTKRFYATALNTASSGVTDASSGALASALHKATRELRDDHSAPLHVWAPYIHTGP